MLPQNLVPTETLEHPTDPNYVADVYNESDGFRFRLVNKKTGQKTLWLGYTMAALVGEVVAVTAYYTGGSTKIAFLTPLEFCQMYCIGVSK